MGVWASKRNRVQIYFSHSVQYLKLLWTRVVFRNYTNIFTYVTEVVHHIDRVNGRIITKSLYTDNFRLSYLLILNISNESSNYHSDTFYKFPLLVMSSRVV